MARLRMVLEFSWVVFGRHVGLLGHLVGILERLVDVLGQLGKKRGVPRVCNERATVAGTQGPPIRILYDFPAIISNITGNIRKEMRKEIRIRI